MGALASRRRQRGWLSTITGEHPNPLADDRNETVAFGMWKRKPIRARLRQRRPKRQRRRSAPCCRECSRSRRSRMLGCNRARYPQACKQTHSKKTTPRLEVIPLATGEQAPRCLGPTAISEPSVSRAGSSCSVSPSSVRWSPGSGTGPGRDPRRGLGPLRFRPTRP